MTGYYGFTLIVIVSVHPSFMCPSIFSFLDDNLSKYQWSSTKLGMCTNIVESWFVIVQLLTELMAHHTMVVGYYCFMFLFLFLFYRVDKIV